MFADAEVVQAEPARALVSVPLRVSVAVVEGRPVVDAPWIAAQVAEANRAFAPAGIRFEVAREDTHDSPTALVTREDRNALAGRVVPGFVNWFVAASLMDVDTPGVVRRGVHWHATRGGLPWHGGKPLRDASPGDPPVHFVIVSAIAQPRVLAHELGHFFGNPKHSDTFGNVMSYEQGDAPPEFDAAQLQRIRRALARFVKAGEFRPARAGRGPLPLPLKGPKDTR